MNASFITSFQRAVVTINERLLGLDNEETVLAYVCLESPSLPHCFPISISMQFKLAKYYEALDANQEALNALRHAMFAIATLISLNTL